MVAALPESEGFVLAGGAAMAAHGLLDRTTRDLDFFGGPTDAAAVQPRADFEHDDPAHEQLLRAVDDWRSRINNLRGRQEANGRKSPPDDGGFGIDF